jgi:hypothetical protein
MDFVRHVLSLIGARGFNAGYGRRSGSAFPIAADESAARIGNGRQFSALLAFAFFLSISSARAAGTDPSPLHCTVDHCGLLADGAYTNLVIGRLDDVGSDADTARVFRWAKAHGYWKNLPAAVQPYLRDVKLVTIAGEAGHPVTLFMLKTEYASAPYHVGDLVRYAPHDAAHDETAQGGPADLALFHGLTGCVATLCQKGDAACFKRYRQGAFTTAHGQQISLATGHLIPEGARIDPVSLLPVR